ncbi:YbaY family lipoprotein [Vibrio chagasii]|nr:YbaY family lipoprotein [Vibrio chagasii]
MNFANAEDYADAPSKVIATQEFTTDGKQVPFAFELGYDDNKIQLTTVTTCVQLSMLAANYIHNPDT